MSDIKITVSGLAGREDHEVPAGTTVADLIATGIVQQGVVVRYQGENVAPGTVLVEGGNYVVTPPAAKHGADPVTITVSSLSGRDEHEVPEGATAAYLFDEGIVQEGCVLRQAGRDVSSSTVLVEGGNYVVTPPAAKHGE